MARPTSKEDKLINHLVDIGSNTDVDENDEELIVEYCIDEGGMFYVNKHTKKKKQN